MLTPERAEPKVRRDVHAAAHHGMSGSAGRLPHAATIQASFGGYDISNVQAHTDVAAASGAAAMGVIGRAI